MARGRMLNRSVCASLKFHQLSDDTARLIATWTIPHLDKNGVFYADPGMVRSLVLPRRSDITPEKVASTLGEMEAGGLIRLFEHGGDRWQWWPGFADNQAGLRADREKTDFPDPAASLPDACRNDAGIMPDTSRKDAAVNGGLNEMKGKERNRNMDAGASVPSTFRAWQKRLQTAKNPVAVIMEMCKHLYPENEQPKGGQVAGTIRTVGGPGRLLGLLWEQSSRPPQGNPVTFVTKVATNAKKRDEPPQPPRGEVFR